MYMIVLVLDLQALRYLIVLLVEIVRGLPAACVVEDLAAWVLGAV